MKTLLEKAIDHMHWSNAASIAWMKENPDAPEGCLRLLSHILNAETIWTARARQESYDRDTFKIHDLGALAARNDANRAGFRKLLDLDLKTPVDYTLIDGSPGRTGIEDMILHAFSHGFHHVGQIAALAGKAGKNFPNVSYIGFTRSW